MARELSRMIPRGLRAALAACAVLCGIALPLASQARDRHVLWTVQGRHNTVYLLGSVHVLRADEGGLPRVAQDAYADAERLVMELDMDALLTDPTAMTSAAQRLALLPAGQSLRSVLGADYGTVQSHAREAGLELGLLDRFQPWFVATALMQAQLAQRGYSSEHGVEETLTRRAMADHKPITGLETVEQQLGVLARMPLPEQKRFLLMSVDEMQDFDAELGAMLGAWRSGDTAKLAALLSDEFDKFPELYRPLTEDRNRAWVGELAQLLDDDDDYLVVVGALHLVGRNSVVDLLRQRGYEVVQQ